MLKCKRMRNASQFIAPTKKKFVEGNHKRERNMQKEFRFMSRNELIKRKPKKS